MRQQGPVTTVWFGMRLGPSMFGIFDAFTGRMGAPDAPSGTRGHGLDGKSARADRQPAGV